MTLDIDPSTATEMRTVQPTDAASELAQLLTSATDSILARANAHLSFIPHVTSPTLVDVLCHPSPPRVSLRALLGVVEREWQFDESLLKVVMNETTCVDAIQKDQLRLCWEWSGCHGVIVDKSRALIARHAFFDVADEIFVIDSVDELTEYLELFEGHWRTTPPTRLVVQYRDALTKSDRQRVHVVSEQYWREVIRRLSEKPEELFSLPPMKFEELVAELLIKDGFDVHITPTVRDDGRDILAWRDLSFGRSVYLVECKRCSPHRPIGVALVRGLYGVVEAERANAGVLVTTSRFTSAAWGFQAAVKWRLQLADYDALIGWLNRQRDV